MTAPDAQPPRLLSVVDGKPGCPEPTWDGPYKMRCSMGHDVCGRHGRFQTRLESVASSDVASAPDAQPPAVPDVWWARHQGQNAVLVQDHGGVPPLLLFVNALFELPANAVRLGPVDAAALAGTTTPTPEAGVVEAAREFVRHTEMAIDAGWSGLGRPVFPYGELRAAVALLASAPTEETDHGQ